MRAHAWVLTPVAWLALDLDAVDYCVVDFWSGNDCVNHVNVFKRPVAVGARVYVPTEDAVGAFIL